MSSPDLWSLFSELGRPAPSETPHLSAAMIPGRPGDYIAKGVDGGAVLLLRGSNKTVVKPPLRLRHVEVDYELKCRIAEAASEPRDGEFIAMRCDEATQPILELFVRTVEALLVTLPTEPSASQTDALMAGLVELFRKLSQPSRRSIKGLWAELFVIDRSAALARIVAAWHGDSTEKYDFVTPLGYLEVKATEQTARVHEFSIAQLRSDSSTNGLVASLQLRRATGGTGILDLARRIAWRLDDNSLRAKLWSNVLEALGGDFAEASDLGFDERFAEVNAKVFAALDVPCVSMPLPRGVTDARVTVDFSAIAPAKCLGLSAVNQLFK